MAQIKVDTITDSAGTGAPAFSQGIRNTATLSQVRVTGCGAGAAGYGTTNTFIRRYVTTEISTGSAITYADSAANGGSFTINETGLYMLCVMDGPHGANSQSNVGISVNSSQLSTDIESITDANRVGQVNSFSNEFVTVSIIYKLTSGDVVRAHMGANKPTHTDNRALFHIIQIMRTA